MRLRCFQCLASVGTDDPDVTYDSEGRALVCPSCRPKSEKEAESRWRALSTGRFLNPTTMETNEKDLQSYGVAEFVDEAVASGDWGDYLKNRMER